MQRMDPILLVEDDEIDTENIRRALKKNKIPNPLYSAVNGADALDFLYHRKQFNSLEESVRPGIIILDLNMPIMNGIEFLKIIKAEERFRLIPVIVLTSSAQEKDRIDSFDLNVSGYMVKPLLFDDFIKIIQVIYLYWNTSELAP